VSLLHFVRHYVALDVQRRSDIGVPHYLLLNRYWRPNRIQTADGDWN
jgi:hypothetical protein